MLYAINSMNDQFQIVDSDKGTINVLHYNEVGAILSSGIGIRGISIGKDGTIRCGVKYDQRFVVQNVQKAIIHYFRLCEKVGEILVKSGFQEHQFLGLEMTWDFYRHGLVSYYRKLYMGMYNDGAIGFCHVFDGDWSDGNPRVDHYVCMPFNRDKSTMIREYNCSLAYKWLNVVTSDSGFLKLVDRYKWTT